MVPEQEFLTVHKLRLLYESFIHGKETVFWLACYTVGFHLDY